MRGQGHSRLAVLVLLTIATTLVTSAQEPSVVEWIQKNAIRLSTPEAGNGFADMQPLKKLIGNARVVSLGEATHGSREFFQLKHRMLEFLATEMGFTIFSIEANMPEAYRLNEYVLNGTGDPAQLLKGMYFWTWDTEEVLAMIQWMREFNRSGKGRIEFTGFDMQTPTVAAENVRRFVETYEASYLTPVRTAIASTSGGSFGVATGTFSIKAAAGKTVKFRGYIKTEALTNGFAGLWWRVDGPDGTLAFDNMSTRGPRGTSEWRPYEIELPVGVDGRNINFGMLVQGTGTVWFDDLSIELDGEPYTDPMFDLAFEGTSLKGFRAGGSGYQTELDPAAPHGGKQSLRIRSDAGPGTASPGETQWKDIIAHMEASRPAYRSAGATPRDVEWALQNARVVFQSLQMRANEAATRENRDRSMADNVKWILDQNPGAKVVLWAHNGHVATGEFGPSMGAALRQTLGAEMVVFGFSFSEGSFQAMPLPGGGRLRNFMVPPAQAGTLDATLASSGFPLFALDLRSAPAWFSEPHGSRSIGAAYPEGEPYAFVHNMRARQAFDVLLFVKHTTAARKNPGW